MVYKSDRLFPQTRRPLGDYPSSSQRLPSSHPLADLASPSLASSVVVVTVVPSIALSLQSHTAFYIKERANGANTHRDESEAPPLLRQVWDYPVPILRVWLPRPSLFSNGHSLPASLPLSLLPSLPNLQQSLAAVSPHPHGERERPARVVCTIFWAHVDGRNLTTHSQQPPPDIASFPSHPSNFFHRPNSPLAAINPPPAT